MRGAIGDVHRRIRELLRNVTLAEVFGDLPGGVTQFGLNLRPADKQLVALNDAN